MKKGKILVIEGTDGSGKQTQTKMLAEKLEKEGMPFMEISFPRYEKTSSEFVKMYLNGEFGEKAEDVSAYTASTFYALDRYVSYKKEFGEFYNNGGIILADRYTTSNMVHQASKIQDDKDREKFLNWLYDYEYKILAIPQPDTVIYLNMPRKYAIQLMKDRENKITHQVQKDIHEKDEEYLQKAYENACNLAKKYNWEEINCIENEKIRTIEDISEEIFNKIKNKYCK